jgi:hypothetical protein
VYEGDEDIVLCNRREFNCLYTLKRKTKILGAMAQKDGTAGRQKEKRYPYPGLRVRDLGFVLLGHD